MKVDLLKRTSRLHESMNMSQVGLYIRGGDFPSCFPSPYTSHAPSASAYTSKSPSPFSIHQSLPLPLLHSPVTHSPSPSPYTSYSFPSPFSIHQSLPLPLLHTPVTHSPPPSPRGLSYRAGSALNRFWDQCTYHCLCDSRC